jgi:hypothetical protein
LAKLVPLSVMMLWGVAVALDDVPHECDDCGAIQFLDGLVLDPLGEFVHSHQEVPHVAARHLERPHHVQAPDSERPSDGDCLEG